MNTLAYINASFLWVFGFAVLYHVVKYWNEPFKRDVRYSEIVYVISFFIIGFYVLNLFEGQPVETHNLNLLYGIMLGAFVAINFWLFGINIIPEMLKVKKNPELIDNDPVITRDYDKFLADINEKYTTESSEDIMKDLTRKALHFVLLAIVIGVHELAHYLEPNLAEMGLTPIVFRNFVYIVAAMFFVFMFTTADLIRVANFKILPNWARKWYSRSLEARTESHTLISSVPFLLTLILFINSPVQVLFSAAVVSSVADAMASIVGKNFGKRKLKSFGRYPEKSVEGLVAGAFSTFVGVWLVFQAYPIEGSTNLMVVAVALVCTFAFIYIDAFAKALCDNILNVIVPGLLTAFCIQLFFGYGDFAYLFPLF